MSQKELKESVDSISIDNWKFGEDKDDLEDKDDPEADKTKADLKKEPYDMTAFL